MTSRVDITKLGRTTPLGLFNYARSFWQAGAHLIDASLGVTHQDAPVTMLLCQAIELYLKAFLRLNGYSKRELKQLSHQYEDIAKHAIKRGLPLSKRDQDVISFLAETNAFIGSRYHRTGPKKVLPGKTISKTCLRLDALIGDALQQCGEPVRPLAAK